MTARPAHEVTTALAARLLALHIVDPNAKLAMVWLALHANEDGVSEVRYDDLSNWMTKAPRTVQRALATLVLDGHARRLERVRDGRGRFVAGLYRLTY